MNGRAEGAGILGGGDRNGGLQHVGEHLHHQRGLLRHAADGDITVNLDATGLEMVHDGLRREGGRLHEGAEEFRRRRAEFQSGQRAGQGVVAEGAAAAVEIVRRERGVLPLRQPRRRLRKVGDQAVFRRLERSLQFGLPFREFAQRPGNQVLHPCVSVAESRQADLEADLAGEDGAVHLGEKAVDDPVAKFLFRHHRHVAGGSAEVHDDGLVADPAADGAGVAVHIARADHDVRPETEFHRPFGTEGASQFMAAVILLRQVQALQARVEAVEEGGRRVAAPFLRPHPLRADAAMAGLEFFQAMATCQ